MVGPFLRTGGPVPLYNALGTPRILMNLFVTRMAKALKLPRRFVAKILVAKVMHVERPAPCAAFLASRPRRPYRRYPLIPPFFA
jgi:hypothetical protein